MQKPLSDELCQQAVDALWKCGGNKTSAAELLKIPRPTFNNRLATANMRGFVATEQKQEVVHGNAPEYDLSHPVPQPFIVGGYSSLYGQDGQLKLQWVKTKLDQQKLEEAIRAAIAGLMDEVPRIKPTKAPQKAISELCNLFPITDYHLGMRAWKPETGENWDLQIAERLLCRAVDYLVDAAPPAKVGILAEMGDFLHFDSLSPVTPTNQHLLDADSRYSKVVQVSVRVLRYAVSKILAKHEKVILIVMEGNHDMASSVWLRHLFMLLFENEPRVEVINSELPYYVHQHGKTMLAFHHGHLKRKEDLPLLFAAQFPKEWGESSYRVCHTGHQHHKHVKEHSGMVVWQHETLAARDAYAARGGWIAGRRMTAITYHTEFHEVATTSVVPEMLPQA